MNTIKSLLFGLIAVSLLAGCGKSSYRKTPGGMPYQLYKGKDTQQVRPGSFIKISFTQEIKDSVYFSTAGGMPEYRQVDPLQVQPYDVSEIWSGLHVGDSIICTQMIDTFIKRDPLRVPPQFKKGDKIVSYFKILAVFPNDSLARLDYEKTSKEWLASEIRMIEKYVADKKINVQKTPSGVLVDVKSPGTGNLADSGNYVSVMYTGTSWSGKKFDSNVDTSFGHAEPLSFVMGTGSMIKGFEEALELLRPGGKAVAYIPSSLAYGGNPRSPNIKPYESLIFEMELIDVKDKMPTRQDMQPPQPGQKIDTPQPNK